MSRYSKFFVNLALWTPVVIFTNNHIASVTRVEGRSMQPSLNPDKNMLAQDLIFVNKWAIRANISQEIKRGDVITFWSPTDPKNQLIKRVIGVPGDMVIPLTKLQGQTPNEKEGSVVVVPKGHCWVEGDEGFHSNDSNMFGCIPLGLITGKATFVLYPFSNAGKISQEIPTWKRKRVFVRE